MTPAGPDAARDGRTPRAQASATQNGLPPAVRRVLRALRALGFAVSLLLIYFIADATLVWRGQLQYNDMLLQHWSSGCAESQPCRFSDVPPTVCRTLTGSVPFPISSWVAATRWRGRITVEGGRCGDPESVVVFVGPQNLDTGESDWLPRYE